MPRPDRLSYDSLETFVALADSDGDARLVAERLGVNKSSVSKRLATLRAETAQRAGGPWIVRIGKRWRLSPEGQRVRLAVADLIARAGQLERFVASGTAARPVVSVACGQEAAAGIVRAAVERFLGDESGAQVRVATPRGKARIEGVAAGQFDVAVVTDGPATIRKYARVETYVAPLFDDHFVLAANPARGSEWGRRWRALSEDRPAAAAELLGMPFVLPEADSSRRQQFDEWCFAATGQAFDAIVEVGGWAAILEYVASGLGVGLVPRRVAEAFRQRRRELSIRPLDAAEFPPDAVRLVTRKAHGREEPELTEVAARFVALLREAAR